MPLTVCLVSFTYLTPVTTYNRRYARSFRRRFYPRPQCKDQFVKIKYDDGTGTRGKIGFISGKELQAPVVQVIQVAQVDDGAAQGNAQPMVVQPDQPGPFKLAVDGMVLDETKAKFVRDYNPKKGEIVQVVEPDFKPGDPAWQDRTVKIEYDVEGVVKTGYLLGLDFAIG